MSTINLRRVACVLGTVAALVTVTSAGQPTTTEPLPSDALFNSDVVQRLELRLHSTDWEKLKQNFREDWYYPADVVHNGATTRNIGIKSRGLGSRNPRKPGIRADMNRYTTDQTYLNLKSFVLDNLVQDASMIKETVAMKLFARLGIPAPREAHVRMYTPLTSTFAGVYGVVESIDKRFLARVFGIIAEDTQNDGYLFDFNYVEPWYFNYLGSDLEAYKLRFSPETKENKSDASKYGPIETLVRLANELPPERYLTELGEHIDWAAFMRYVAAQNFVAQNDGFLGYAGMNNFYLYRLENSTRHVFIAWDEDNAFADVNYAIDARHQENVLMRKAMQVPELADMYYASLRDAVASASEPTGPSNTPWLEFEMQRQLDLIAQPLREDEFKPYSVGDHETEKSRMLDFARNRAGVVREALRAIGR